MLIDVQDRDRGFSLIEALIALFILSVGLLSVAQLMMVSLDRSEAAKYDTKAVQLAQAKVEELRLLFGRSVDSGQTPEDLSAGSHGPITVELENPDDRIQNQRSFQVSWDVQELDAGQKTVVVTVTPVTGNPHQTEIITLTTRLTP
jgi:type IV pilus modification protein PilV